MITKYVINSQGISVLLPPLLKQPLKNIDDHSLYIEQKNCFCIVDIIVYVLAKPNYVG